MGPPLFSTNSQLNTKRYVRQPFIKPPKDGVSWLKLWLAILSHTSHCMPWPLDMEKTRVQHWRPCSGICWRVRRCCGSDGTSWSRAGRWWRSGWRTAAERRIRLIDWLIDWLIDSLVAWLIDWLNDRLVAWLIGCLTYLTGQQDRRYFACSRA